MKTITISFTVCIMLFMTLTYFFNPGTASAAEDDIQDRSESKKREITQEKDIFDYSLESFIMGRYINNYMNYRVSSPTAEAGFRFIGKLDTGTIIKPSIDYKLNGEKYFIAVDGTKQTLDSLRQDIDLEADFRIKDVKTSIYFDYSWLFRPAWPDLYQPRGGDPANGYLSTDRYSYHLLNPGTIIRYKGFSKTIIWGTLEYKKKLGYIDPHYSSAVPTHLTPNRYNEFSLEVGYRTFNPDRIVNVRISNTTNYHTEDKELARDAQTGKTNYTTASPNPLYREIHNETDLEIPFTIKTINMEIAPFYKFHYNNDLFDGYYTYTEHKIGFKVAGTFAGEKLEYDIRGERRLKIYTDNGYAGTTDGKILYKYYWVASAHLDWHAFNNFTVFVESAMKIKDTNYPSYDFASGDSYDVDFFYNNYSIDLGVKYLL